MLFRYLHSYQPFFKWFKWFYSILSEKRESGVKQVVQEGHDLINRFMRLRKILGRNPEFCDLYDAGFLREEIDLLEFVLDQTQFDIEDISSKVL